MKIAIHHKENSFSERWIDYCKEKDIAYKLVNCYQTDIIQQLSDCDALMWHFHHTSPKDFLFAKQLLFSFQIAGKTSFPDFNTMWHFDDKVGQKYLLEAIGVPFVPSYVFYSKIDALKWAKETKFPKVFKLRGGAGSQNVRLARKKEDAIKLINQAFGKGFSQYDALSNLKELIRKYRTGKTTLVAVGKGTMRLGYNTEFSRIKGKERGYVYFQDFIFGNSFDIRIVVIDNKAFALKRMVRKNDFRASGSGDISYEKHHFNEKDIQLAFKIHYKLKSQCTAIDLVYENDQPKLIEISYGFSPEGYDPCPGYWDKNLNWIEGKFNPYGWMVELLLKSRK